MKVPGWQDALSALVCERLHTPFKWGAHDCCLFSADAVLLQTGEDPAAEIRGTYTDERGAVNLMRAMGGLRGVAHQALGEPIPALLAQVGDVVLVSAGKRDALAICNGSTALAPSSVGLVPVPMGEARMAWGVR